MKKKTNTYAIVLDTNSFGKANKYNFKKSRITMCVEHLKEYSNIKIFMPSIVYSELKKDLPKIGVIADTPMGMGKVVSVDVFKKTYKVLLPENEILIVEVKDESKK